VHSRGAHSAGTGLGLALAKRFIEAHGGTIAVESAIGSGTTFIVRLPCAPAPAAS
jgi:signal transduction histidine kinase